MAGENLSQKDPSQKVLMEWLKVGPEFKPQHCKNKQTNKSNIGGYYFV
jgi:hypothetical protein